MFVSPKYAKANKLYVSKKIMVVGGKLNGMELDLVESDRIPPNQCKIDYKNIYGSNLSFLDEKSRLLVMFPKNKLGAHGRRNTILLIGSSGAGKSTTCIDYALLYRMVQFPNHVTHPIYWISRTCDDSRLDKLKGKALQITDPDTGETTTRYIDNKMIFVDLRRDSDWDRYFVNPETKLNLYFDEEQGITTGNLTNSLVIIDDASGLPSAKNKILDSLIKEIANLGRHTCTNLVWSRHEYSGYRHTERSSLAEFDLVYLYCKSELNMKQIAKFSKDILNTPEIIEFAREVSNYTRYVAVSTSVPAFIMTSREVVVI